MWLCTSSVVLIKRLLAHLADAGDYDLFSYIKVSGRCLEAYVKPS